MDVFAPPPTGKTFFFEFFVRTKAHSPRPLSKYVHDVQPAAVRAPHAYYSNPPLIR